MKIANFSSLFFTVIRGTGLYVDMEFWTEVRRQVLVGGLSKRGAVKRYGISWHTLEKILDREEPPGYRQKQPRSKPKIDERCKRHVYPILWYICGTNQNWNLGPEWRKRFETVKTE